MVTTKIYTTKDNQTLDTFIIQNSEGHPISDANDIKLIRETLLEAIGCKEKPEFKIPQHMPRILKSFQSPTNVGFTQDLLNHRTIMEITTVDRPGLLYTLANLIAKAELEVKHAKIATLGERVEDIFYLTNPQHHAVRDLDLLETLKKQIIATLDQEQAA